MTRTTRLLNGSLTDYLSQTLTKLMLCDSRIGDHGVEHLANALRQNKVISPLSFLLSYYQSLTFSSINLPHLISMAIKSAIKELNI